MLSKKEKIYKEELKKEIYFTVKKTKAEKVAVSFSGGLDSSLLAKVCQDLKKDVTLLTVGFSGASDFDYAEKVSSQLKLPLLIKKLEIEKLEKDLKRIISWVKFSNFTDLEISLAHFYSFLLARTKKINIVLTANGLDTLFCGFEKYRRILDEAYPDNKRLKQTKEKISSLFALGKNNSLIGSESIGKYDSKITGELKLLQKKDIKQALENEKRYEKIANSLKIKKISPFLESQFIDFALTIPLEFKIKGPNDSLRKHILREVAWEIGVPKIAVLRPKKAIQYSSKIDWAVEKLAKAQGITREIAKRKGFKGIKEAYFFSYFQG